MKKFDKFIISLVIVLFLISFILLRLEERKRYNKVEDFIEQYGWNVKNIYFDEGEDIFLINSSQIYMQLITDFSKKIGININKYDGEVVYHIGISLEDEIFIDIDGDLHKIPLEATVWTTKNYDIAFAVLRVAFGQVYYYPLDVSIEEVEVIMDNIY